MIWMVSTLLIFFTISDYIGCYEDFVDRQRDLNGDHLYTDKLDVQMCIDYCAVKVNNIYKVSVIKY